MPTVQQWGRRESIIWPPRGYLYTVGAFFLACVATGFFVYLRFQFGLQPLQRYYLPYYLRSVTAGIAHSASKYEMLYVSDGETPGRAALEADVQPGSTPPVSYTHLDVYKRQGCRSPWVDHRPLPGRPGVRVTQTDDTSHTRGFPCPFAVTNRGR